MDHHGVSSPLIPSSCLQSLFQETSTSSYVMWTSPQRQSNMWAHVNAQLIMRLPTLLSTENGEPNWSSSVMPGMINVSHFAITTPLPVTTTTTQPHPYNASLTPNPSPLRPHCLTRDHLCLWRPYVPCSCLDHTGALIRISDSDIDRIILILAHSHASSM